ncbi:hypothetical protein FB451DRAFT_1178843 [Mycena latifolia]|nr:hypothetical protein FB451DRAFT_1178843 [Mycena latifolia]
MHDNVTTQLQLAIVFWALLFIPSTILRYVALGVLGMSLVIYAVHYKLPSTRLARLIFAITVAADILARAKFECLRNQLDLADEECHLLQARISASKIKSSLLKARDAPWETYLDQIRAIQHSLDKSERQVRELQTATLLIIETEYQRKLAEHMNECREIVNTVLRSPTAGGGRAQ